jgi:hypothetical protein
MTGDIGEQGTCTTCVFSEDFSNYWTAVLFFKHQNGTYKRVPIMANDALPAGINGGMTIYYTQQDFNSNGKQFIRTFPPVRNMLLFVRCLVAASFFVPNNAPNACTIQMFLYCSITVLTCYSQGFRMTVGSPTQGKDGITRHKGLRFTCLDNKSTRFPEIDDFPKKPCKGGIMTEHHFPA